MPDSERRQIEYLKYRTGGQAKVRLAGELSGKRLWILSCRYCSTPNPAGGEPIKVKVEGGTKISVLTQWLIHEATRQHEIERDRALGTEPAPRR